MIRNNLKFFATDEERINDKILESTLVHSDPQIDKYYLPNRSQLQEVLMKARIYKGTWYHSVVILRKSLNNTPELMKVKKLGADAGIYIENILTPEVKK